MARCQDTLTDYGNALRNFVITIVPLTRCYRELEMAGMIFCKSNDIKMFN